MKRFTLSALALLIASASLGATHPARAAEKSGAQMCAGTPYEQAYLELRTLLTDVHKIKSFDPQILKRLQHGLLEFHSTCIKQKAAAKQAAAAAPRRLQAQPEVEKAAVLVGDRG
jgi:hypothetical protein